MFTLSGILNGAAADLTGVSNSRKRSQDSTLRKGKPFGDEAEFEDACEQ